jgi:hypothetical protein
VKRLTDHDEDISETSESIDDKKEEIKMNDV